MSGEFNVRNPVDHDKQVERQNYQENDQGAVISADLNELIIPQANILFDYQNVTWNFTLSAMTASEFKLYQINPDSDVRKVVIAKSGVTGKYSINSVRMDGTAPGMNGSTSNNSILTTDIEIHEQGAMTFYDELASLSYLLNYKKFADIPMILELDFVGYDPITNQPTVIPGASRAWKVRILSIAANATLTGATMKYTLKCTVMRHQNDPEMVTLKQPMTISANSVGDFCSKLEEQVNESYFKDYGYLIPIMPELANNKVLNITVADSIKNVPFIADKQDTAQNAGAPKTFRMEAKDTIFTALDSMMDMAVANVDDPSKRTFVHAIVNASYVGYDPFRYKTVYKYEVFVVPYFTGDVNDIQDVRNKNTLKDFVSKATTDIINNNSTGLLNMKRYDYQFTGLNTEIVNLDIKFDTQFQLAVQRNLEGTIDQSNSAGTHESTIIINNQVFDVNTQTQQIYQHMQELSQKEATGKLTDQEEIDLARSRALFEEKNFEMEGEREQENRTMETIGLNGDRNAYIEDFGEIFDMPDLVAMSKVATESTSISVEMINIKETNSNTYDDNSTSDETNRRLIRSNYYNRAFMTRLDMTVVGDPYWLGYGDREYYSYLDAVVRAQAIEDQFTAGVANYVTSEPYLLLNLKPASSIDDTTGILKPSPASIMSQNIYRILKVTHIFSESGKFTQQLVGSLLMRSLRRGNE